jgi:hypothetical protein
MTWDKQGFTNKDYQPLDSDLCLNTLDDLWWGPLHGVSPGMPTLLSGLLGSCMAAMLGQHKACVLLLRTGMLVDISTARFDHFWWRLAMLASMLGDPMQRLVMDPKYSTPRQVSLNMALPFASSISSHILCFLWDSSWSLSPLNGNSAKRDSYTKSPDWACFLMDILPSLQENLKNCWQYLHPFSTQ